MENINKEMRDRLLNSRPMDTPATIPPTTTAPPVISQPSTTLPPR
jgi:hypothetical protein